VSKKAKILITALIFYCFFITDQVSAANVAKPIYSMAVSGNVSLNKSDSYARIILTDTSDNEYLIYEAQGPFDSGSFSFENTCEETCVLNGIVPKKVDVEVSDATITISQIITLENKQGLNQQVRTMGIKSYRADMDKSQEQSKIDKINQYIEEKGLSWTAGETSVSKYSHTEKKKLFGFPEKPVENLPNLQGFEYYKGGVFETVESKSAPMPSSSSRLPKFFDWRNRHGENWLTPVRDQGAAGTCWAHANIAALEAQINLYYNRHLNIDLSEQMLVDCGNVGPIEELSGHLKECSGNKNCYPGFTYCKIMYKGVADEACDPYAQRGLTYNPSYCDRTHICSDWKYRVWKISDFHDYKFGSDRGTPYCSRQTMDLSQEDLKRVLIEKGPMDSAYQPWNHAMALVGYDTDLRSGKTIWIFKNSWGSNYGEDGYVKMSMGSLKDMGWASLPISPIIPPPLVSIALISPKINCIDKDKDGYCNWGISITKPNSCPASCKLQKDCDDSNASLGAFDSNFNCGATGSTPSPTPTPTPISTDTTPPQVGKIKINTAKVNESQIFNALVSDNRRVAGCDLFVEYENKGSMDLSESPCLNCTALKVYAFNAEGGYSAYVKCWDEAGNTTEGPATHIIVSAPCPDCQSNHTDLCESPPKCEEDCGASAECDEKKRFTGWSSGNTCHFCGSGCDYNTDKTKPSDNILLGDLCYFDCNIDCGGSGWTTTYHSSICKTENCSKTKMTGNICYYLRSCGTSGCGYLNTDTNKLCNNSTCTESGWDNSTCQGPFPADNWKPCNPSPSWVCGESQNGSSPFCEGTHIGWGWGDDGEVVCPEGTIVTEGLCNAKNDDSVKKQEIRVNMVPSPATFSNTTTFVPQSSWYCKFSCSRLFCGADGCAWSNCEAGNQSIDKIELKIYNLSGSLVYNKTVSNQGNISWNGKNNQGQQLANGIYAYQTKVYLKNAKNYTNQGNIVINR